MFVFFSLLTSLYLANAIELSRLKRNAPYFGIPVPGQSIGASDIFQLLRHSCLSHDRRYETIVSDSISLLANQPGALAQQMYNNLYFSLGEVDIGKLMGKWFKMFDSAAAHKGECVVSFYKIIQRSDYLTSFTIREYSSEGEEVRLREGFGEQIGTDAGQLLIYSGHESDRCPYTLVKVGPEDEQGRYEYMVLTQILKHPILVLARDPANYQLYHKEEVERFLRASDFQNPLAPSFNPLDFPNFLERCILKYYYHLED